MHLMIDIETLGTSPGSVICSVGFARFNEKGIESTGYWSLDWQNQIDCGKKVEAATLQWWLKQGDTARIALTSGLNRVTRDELLENLVATYAGCKYIWGNSPSFDLGLLQSYLRCSFWEFWQERDVRTIKDLAQKAGVLTPFAGVAHNPEDDARNQAQMIIAYWEAIK